MWEFFLTVLSVIFIAMLLSVALTFGMILLVWFVGLAVAVSLFVFLRNCARRWLFLYGGRPPQGPPPVKAPPSNITIIEAEFEDLPPKH